jgi:hypothetical protein
VTDLLHELEVKGLSGGGGELEEHTVLVEGYSGTVWGVKGEGNRRGTRGGGR